MRCRGAFVVAGFLMASMHGPARAEFDPRASAPMTQPAADWLESGWQRVQASWDQSAAHERLLSEALARDDLASLGARYRGYLEAHPGDAMATRAREELLRRATAAMLTRLPREESGIGPAQARTVRNVVLGIFLLVTICVGAWLIFRMGAG